MAHNDFKHFSTLYLYLHLATIFVRLVAKRRLKDFFNFERTDDAIVMQKSYVTNTQLILLTFFPSFLSLRSELWIIMKKSGLISFLECLSFTSGTVATFLTVFAFVLTGNVVLSSTAFMILPFMSILRLSVSNIFPAVFEIFVSLRRIEKFLLLDNIPLDSLEYKQTPSDQKQIYEIKKIYPELLVRQPSLKQKETDRRKDISGNQVEGHSVSVYGDMKQHVLPKETDVHLSVSRLVCNLNGSGERYLLKDVSFDASEGSLTVITGQVGSGKSTLLAAIAGEVIKSSGGISCSGTVAYVPQTAWVFSGTLRENVLFGEPYDEKRFAEVIDSCSLREDIVRFPNGDLSFIGEHGVVLSGGQRARVNLARAVYADADVYLLDNPLSAVDVKVGEHIFNQCICKLLQKKITILVTYAEVHMKAANQIVVLHKGSVLRKGNFQELQDGGKILDTIIGTSATTSKENIRSTTTDENGVPFSCANPVSGSFVEHLKISEEEKATGKISSGLYWDYFRAGMHPVAMILLVILFVITQGEHKSIFNNIQRN